MEKKMMLDMIEEMGKRRAKVYTKQADIKRILHAKFTGNWKEVHNSNLYKNHGGEYCELLQIIQDRLTR